jgi:hypothetical protein
VLADGRDVLPAGEPGVAVQSADGGGDQPRLDAGMPASLDVWIHRLRSPFSQPAYSYLGDRLPVSIDTVSQARHL